MLTRDNFTGPWAGLPVAWTDDDRFDEETYRADVARCCEAGIPGVYTAGTSGEFYAAEYEEWHAIARATVEECHARSTPAMIGCSSTYTRGAVLRAAAAVELGADAVQVALPFWMETADDQVIPFFAEVAAAVDGLPLSIYETSRAKKLLSLDQHRAVKEAVPAYLMIKATAGVGTTPDGCRALSEIVNVFVGEGLWPTLGPCGAGGCCSAMVYWNPRLVLAMWELLREKDWDRLREACAPADALHAFLGERYAPLGFTDTAYDRMGGLATGFLKTSLRNRAPYIPPTERDVEDWRQWCRENFPEMLKL